MTIPADEMELRALLEKAMPGPWRVKRLEAHHRIISPALNDMPGHRLAICELHHWGPGIGPTVADQTAHAVLIAATRNALPVLLDRLEKMRGELKTLEQSAAAEVALFESNINGAGMNDYGTPGYVPSATLSAWSGSLAMARHLHRQIEAARTALSQGEVNQD